MEVQNQVFANLHIDPSCNFCGLEKEVLTNNGVCGDCVFIYKVLRCPICKINKTLMEMVGDNVCISCSYRSPISKKEKYLRKLEGVRKIRKVLNFDD